MRKWIVAVTVAVGMAGAALSAQPPQLSELEQLKIQVLQLKIQVANIQAEADACRGLLGQYRVAKASTDLSAEELALKKAIETAHPGFTWDPRTGALVEKEGKK